MNTRALGVTSILVATGPIGFMVVFRVWAAAGLSPDDAADPTIMLPFLRAHAALVLPPTITSAVMHVAAIVLAVGLLPAARTRAPLLAGAGAALGVFWGLVDVTKSIVLYESVLGRVAADASTIAVVTNGLQSAGHLAGGLWTFSVVATTRARFGAAHRLVGAAAGVALTLHPFVVPLVPRWWGLEMLLVPLWFGWTGVALLRSSAQYTDAHAAQ